MAVLHVLSDDQTMPAEAATPELLSKLVVEPLARFWATLFQLAAGTTPAKSAAAREVGVPPAPPPTKFTLIICWPKPLQAKKIICKISARTLFMSSATSERPMRATQDSSTQPGQIGFVRCLRRRRQAPQSSPLEQKLSQGECGSSRDW